MAAEVIHDSQAFLRELERRIADLEKEIAALVKPKPEPKGKK